MSHLFSPLGDLPEQAAVLTVYHPIQEAIVRATNVAHIAGVELQGLDVPPYAADSPATRLNDAHVAVEWLNAGLADPRIGELDPEPFEILRKAAAFPNDCFALPDDVDVKVLRGILGRKSSLAAAPQPDVLLLHPFQESILKALDGRALNKAALAREVCGREDYGNLLYRPKGLKGLRDLELVKHKRGIGFYRPDSPPPNARELD